MSRRIGYLLNNLSNYLSFNFLNQTQVEIKTIFKEKDLQKCIELKVCHFSKKNYVEIAGGLINKSILNGRKGLLEVAYFFE